MARKKKVTVESAKVAAKEAGIRSDVETPKQVSAPFQKRSHWPELAREVPSQISSQGGTWRHLAMATFLHGRGDQKFIGLKNSILATWPRKFVKDVRFSPQGNQFYTTKFWNPWLDRLLAGFVNEKYAVRQGDSVFRFIGLTGSAASGKTHGAGLFAVIWWMLDPENSIAVLTSTTKDMIRSRVWSVIRDYASSGTDIQTGQPVEIGHLIDSQMKLLPLSKDPKHSIAAYAVAHGETLKAVDNLKGLHAQRMLVIIDEANGTPEAIFNVIPNYRKGCRDLTVIVLGNPVSRLDPHGRALKPKEGWALTLDDRQIEWQTEGVNDWQIESGLCLRFDGRDSPNCVLKRDLYPYLYSYDNWCQAELKFCAHGGTFSYWAFDRGQWPVDGLQNVIFTEQLFLRCDAIGTHFTFESEREACLSCDPGFGGDACMVYFGYLGDVGGRKCLQLVEHFEIPIDPTMVSTDIDYQIARRVQQECIVRKVKPSCFAIDSTGIGRGVASILAAEWSNQIQCVNFGQAATDRASSQNDGRPAREVYTNYVTELWYAVREAMEAGQVRGFSNDCVTQLCSRQYEMKGRKMQAEPKSDMKLRLRYSPDIGDAAALLVEVARRNGLTIEGKQAMASQVAWNRESRAIDQVYGESEVKDEGGWAEQEVHQEVYSVLVQAEDWD